MVGAEIVCQNDSNDTVESRFMNHINEYGLMTGTTAEYDFRFALFKETDLALQEINMQEGNTFVVSHNQFSTMTQDEKNRYKGRIPHARRNVS